MLCDCLTLSPKASFVGLGSFFFLAAFFVRRVNNSHSYYYLALVFAASSICWNCWSRNGGSPKMTKVRPHSAPCIDEGSAHSERLLGVSEASFVKTRSTPAAYQAH